MMAHCKRYPFPMDRFWKKVDRSGDGCWEWKSYRNASGYGTIYCGKLLQMLAHRVAWQSVHGDIPDGLFVCHTCDNRGCCNPAHLFLGTNQDNMTDAKEKGRTVRQQGEKHPQSILSEEQVIYGMARMLVGESQSSVARDFGVHRNTMQSIWMGRRWTTAFDWRGD